MSFWLRLPRLQRLLLSGMFVRQLLCLLLMFLLYLLRFGIAGTLLAQLLMLGILLLLKLLPILILLGD